MVELESAERQSLARHWTRQAELEHASIGAFSRFVLELLALGAPAELVSRATQALADETAHARACYALASAYARKRLGPAPLDARGALDDLSLAGIVERAVIEGCVGETLAAVEASVASEEARDPVVRATLLRISEQEGDHAELSWLFLRWALAQGQSGLVEIVERSLANARDELERRAAPTTAAPDLRRHGVLSEQQRTALALRVFTEVVSPCARLLLGPFHARGNEGAASSDGASIGLL
jgi:hypothetical protein